MKQTIIFLVAALLGQALIAVEPVSIDIQADWEKAIADSEGVVVENGAVSPKVKLDNLRPSCTGSIVNGRLLR